MEYVTRIRDTSLLACKTCRFALIPSRIDSHFQQPPHRLDIQTRNNIISYIRQLSSLVTNNDEIRETINQIPRNPKYFPELTLYQDGFECQEHSYIVRNVRSIQIHYRDFHNWINPRGRGQKISIVAEVPWNINVPCQRFFHINPGQEYFRVTLSSRVSPSHRRDVRDLGDEMELDENSSQVSHTSNANDQGILMFIRVNIVLY